jgi:hypothetical protein
MLANTAHCALSQALLGRKGITGGADVSGPLLDRHSMGQHSMQQE